MNRPSARIFFALFTVSGFAGLIYQSIWSHYLKLFLGHAAYAQTLVLAIFMGGMAIGSWLAARWSGRATNLLLGYALCELGIGALAIVFDPAFRAATAWAFDSVLPALGGRGTDLFKWTLGSLLILPASVLLGATFPLMSGGVMRLHPSLGGRSLAMLYFTNSFGAAIGVLASGFYLIDRFGLPGTVLTAGLMNVALALAVWLVVRGWAVQAPAPTPEPARGGDDAVFARATLILAFGTGAASFVYEVTWIRMLSAGLGASSHAFEVMLAAFILGMSAGAWWLRDRISRIADTTGWLAAILALKAAFAVYAIWAYDDVLHFMAWMMHAVAHNDSGYVLDTIAGLGASILVMFPAAFFAGTTLPLATYALTSRGFGEPAIGKVYAANTAGCIVGAIFATHVGMELLGVKGLTGAGAAVDLAVGMLIYVVAGRSIRPTRLAAATAAAAFAVAFAFYLAPLDRLAMSSGVYRYGEFYDPRASHVAFYRDGKTATISVVDTGPLRTIITNGKPDASVMRDPGMQPTPDEGTMVLAAALPLAMKPGAELVANIGFGSGLTTHALLGSPRVRRVDTIEIERMMVEGARLFDPRNRRAYQDPRSRIHIEDAKTYFASGGTRYDVITSEPSNPWVSGVSTLFSQEFYAQLKRYLKDDGLFVQWIQTYEIDLDLISTVFNALDREFGDYAVFHTGSDLLVVATPAGKLPPLRDDLFSYPGLKAELDRLGFEQLGDLQALRLGGRASMRGLFLSTGYAPNSDFFPILDQQAPRARFREQGLGDLLALRGSLAPVLPLLDGDFRMPLRRLQNAGSIHPESIDLAARAGEAIGVALTGQSDRATRLPAAARASATLVYALMQDCRASPREWTDALTQVAAIAIPYVEEADVAPLIARAKDSPCARSLDEIGRHRLALLAAINARDARSIFDEARLLLERDARATEPDRVYYLASAIVAGIAGGRVGDAVALRDANLPRISAAGRQDLALRLALANLALASFSR